jgi:rubrerythrin
MISARSTSRKGFLAGAAVGAGALLAGCGGDDAPEPGPNRGKGSRDVAVLNAALEREHAAVALYTAGLGIMRGSRRTTVDLLLEQERAHVRGLSEAIRDLGGTPRGPAEGSAIRRQLGVDRVSGAGAFMALATRVENAAIAAYLEQLPELSDGRLRQTAAAILANEAEHVAMLTGLRRPGRPALQAPVAFVVGSTP